MTKKRSLQIDFSMKLRHSNGPRDYRQNRQKGRRSVGNMRQPGQSLEYRDLFSGSGQKDEWRDEKMTFFEAVFSGCAHPDLSTRAMNEGDAIHV